jgi:hypothetical protein
LRDLVRDTAGGIETTTADEERFLALKGQIAREFAYVETRLPGALRLDAVRQGKRMHDSLGRFRTLAGAAKATAPEREAFEAVWQEGFLFLNKVQGVGLSPQHEPRASRSSGRSAGIPRPRMPRPAFGAYLLRFVVQLGILAAILYLIGRTLGIEREPTGQWVFHPPTSFAGVGTNLWEGARSLLGKTGVLLTPVVDGYGIEVTIFLLGVLLLSAGYWVFIRSR